MLSRSAIVKLKAILVIDLIIVGSAAGLYLYFQDQGLVTGGGSKPAKFILTDLVISPNEAYAGEAVAISVNVTNIGELEGNLTVNLQINDAIKDTANLTLAGNSSEIVEFSDIEMLEGTYNVTIGDLTGFFIINTPPPESSKIILSSLKVDPYEVWVDEPVTLTVTAENPTSEADKILIRIMVDDIMVKSQVIELEAKETQTVSFNVSASTEGKHTIKVNTLSGSFTIVKTGYHTLTINRSGGGSKSLPFKLNGVEHGTPYTELLPVGEYYIELPNPFDVGTGVLAFSSWNDGVNTPNRAFNLDRKLILVVTYQLISGYASCPSLYIWNGNGYSYVTDVSNPGWLGYISYITSDGTIVFGGGNPWDYVKLDKNVLALNNGYFDMTLTQQWDELFYLDAAYMLVVDHPIGTDVYTSMTNYLNKGETGQIYTVTNGTLLTPVSATNEKGQDVLAQILYKDGVFTPGINGIESPSWDNIIQNQLTLDLGNLSGASSVKLVITGMVDWGSADTYYAYLDLFKTAAAQGLVPNGTQVMPAPYMEVMDANGNWIRAPQDKQIPLPSDYNARTFIVDLTGLFPEGVTDYKVRFTNFWNVTYDYIGIDITPKQPIPIQKITPTTATLSQLWDTQSKSSGAFTRYGDVTELMQAADDMYVIGRQGDQVNMQFSTANLEPVKEGMERDYFFVVACWFKDPPGEWGYGFDFTVNPLPFIAMSGFPYSTAESYPYDAAHLAYIQQYNTRIIP
ncbi:MAG: hypothetical protein NWE98_10095 [Candidatus Bathyarchaeota archaeon]|nr:hypothetical protein [Candidatus Bathyarchaeota archaeon]